MQVIEIDIHGVSKLPAFRLFAHLPGRACDGTPVYNLAPPALDDPATTTNNQKLRLPLWVGNGREWHNLGPY